MHAEAQSLNYIWAIEDNAKYLDTIKKICEITPDISCLQYFYDCDSALKQLKRNKDLLPPDVILLDIGLPGMSGLEAISKLKIRLPDTKIVMLTIKDDKESIFQAFSNGASGYLSKEIEMSQIISAIREASKGGMVMPEGVAEKVMSFFHAQRNFNLTKREKEVLSEMANGLLQKEIAAKLYISESTVNSHIQNIYVKLQVNNGPQAVAKALRNKIIF